MATEKTLESELPWLLDELCVELGFCLPPTVREALMNAPPRDIDVFTDAVFAAEGMDPSLRKQLRRAVHDKIERRVGHLMDSPPGDS
jgi:hypothetical protein